MEKSASSKVTFVPSREWLIESRTTQLNKLALIGSTVLESTVFFQDVYGSEINLSGWKVCEKNLVSEDSVLMQCKKVLAGFNDEVHNQTCELLEKIDAFWKIMVIVKNDNCVSTGRQLFQVIWEDQNLCLEKEIACSECPYTDEALQIIHLTEYCLHELMDIATQIQQETVLKALKEEKKYEKDDC